MSFNAVQNFDPKWGLFLRANATSGTATQIETSIAWGGIYNNPFGRNHLDQVGLRIFWDKTNLKVVTKPARNAEWGAEFYHNYVLFKGLWFTPDIQVHFAPALHPGAGPPSASGLPVRCAFSSHRTSIRVLFLRRHLRRTQRPPAGASKRAIGASRHCSTRSRAALAPIGRS